MKNRNQLALELGPSTARSASISPPGTNLTGAMEDFIGSDITPINYMYSGFALTMLPHKRIDDSRHWQKDNGRFTMLVEPGKILQNNKVMHYGVPYGSRARLIMFFLQTEAIKTRSRVVHLGSTMNQWLRSMSIPTGGKNYGDVREQARRLSACRLTVGWQSESGESGFRRENIVGAMFIPSDSEDQGGNRWGETAELSEGFYQALLEHPVPCNGNAITELQSSSHCIDVYVWLCYRMRWIALSGKPVTVPWKALHDQFGGTYKELRQFRWRFKDTLMEVCRVYPEANIDLTESGIVLKQSPLAVPDRAVRRVILPEGMRKRPATVPLEIVRQAAIGAD